MKLPASVRGSLKSLNFLRRRFGEGWGRTCAIMAARPLLMRVVRSDRGRAWLDEHKLLYALRRHTLVNYARLRALYGLAEAVLTGPTPGCVVECGVWNGGSAALFGCQARRFRADTRFWLFDSFQGLPEPGPGDRTWRGHVAQRGELRGCRATVDELLFDRLGLDPCLYEIAGGWFHETLPAARPRIGPIALLHVDCDFYEPVHYCLEQLYPLVAPGGAVVLDDYHYFEGCRAAVDEFRRARDIRAPLVPTDRFGVYFLRPS